MSTSAQNRNMGYLSLIKVLAFLLIFTNQSFGRFFFDRVSVFWHSEFAISLQNCSQILQQCKMSPCNLDEIVDYTKSKSPYLLFLI